MCGACSHEIVQPGKSLRTKLSLHMSVDNVDYTYNFVRLLIHVIAGLIVYKQWLVSARVELIIQPFYITFNMYTSCLLWLNPYSQ